MGSRLEVFHASPISIALVLDAAHGLWYLRVSINSIPDWWQQLRRSENIAVMFVSSTSIDAVLSIHIVGLRRIVVHCGLRSRTMRASKI